MSQRISSDDVPTVRATLARSGRTARPRIELPAEERERFPTDEIVRVVIDESEYRTRIDSQLSGDGLQITGVYDTPRLVRNPGEGTNRLAEWKDDADLSFGQSILVDVVDPEFKYGLREPGQRTIYGSSGAPDDSLASIAKQVEED